MRHATYTGPDKTLRGETALVRPYQKGEVLAQFDCVGLEDAHGTQLGGGWHSFPAAHFDIDEDEI